VHLSARLLPPEKDEYAFEAGGNDVSDDEDDVYEEEEACEIRLDTHFRGLTPLNMSSDDSSYEVE
jgi:hypothetical protein